MSHVRKQIRDAVVLALNANPELTGIVFANKQGPFDASELPAINVSTSDILESCEKITANYPWIYERKLPVRVALYARNSLRIENALDEFAVKIESTLQKRENAFLGGLVKVLTLETTEAMDTLDADAPVGSITLTFMATYHTRCDQPDIAV